MLERGSSKRTHPDAEQYDKPASRRHQASASAELTRLDTVAALTLNGAGGSTSDMNAIAGDSFGAISGGINGGRLNTYNITVLPAQGETLRTQIQVPEALKQAIAPSAFHNSMARGDPPKCHPNTRTAVQQKILNWVRGLDPTTKDFAIMWMYGPAGSGKTAIAQTTAETLYEMKMLLASFFFSRLDPSRNCSRFLVATIAYQIASCLPDQVAGRIYTAVSKNPHVFQLSLRAQIAFLLVEPLQPLVESGYFDDDSSARAIVIDGLDECIDPKEQVDVLLSLSAALRKHRLPIRFLIASRPEIEIKDSFNSNVMNSSSTRLPLADNYQADSDIKQFLSDEFQKIKQTHMLGKRLPAEWPSDNTMQQLLRKSSGQFIYASTVVKFVKSPRHRPDQRLLIILGLRPPGKDLPFADLDALYRHLFSTVDDWEKVSLILAFCILRTDSSNFSVRVIEALLCLEPGDCRLLLCDLGSIIGVCKISLWRNNAYRVVEELKFFHASLQDFLLDKARSNEFHIDPAMGHAKLIRRFFQFFQGSSPRKWKADCTDSIDLTIIKPHIELSHSSQELEGDILSFEVLRFFDHDFPRHVAYSIPDYLSIIKNSRLEGATAIYQKQERAFHEHLKKELRRYYEGPCLDFFLLCIVNGFFGQRGPILKDKGQTLRVFVPMRDSLWVEAGWTEAQSSYIQALKVAAKEIISEQSEQMAISAALYTLKEASEILTQKKMADRYLPTVCVRKKHFFLESCSHLLEKAAWSEDIINLAQDLALPLILDHHPGDVCKIDTAAQNYLARMNVTSKQDYASLSRQALTKVLELVNLERKYYTQNDDDKVHFLIQSCQYLVKKACPSREFVDFLQGFQRHLLWESGYLNKVHLVELDILIHDYFAVMNKAVDLDYISSACCALELFYWMSASPEDSLCSYQDCYFDIADVVEHCTCMLEKAGRSKKLIAYVPEKLLHSRSHSLYPHETQIVEDALEEYHKRMDDDDSQPFVPSSVGAGDSDTGSDTSDQDIDQQ